MEMEEDEEIWEEEVGWEEIDQELALQDSASAPIVEQKFLIKGESLVIL